MTHDINPSQVLTFLEVVRTGSVSLAARNLLIGQPAVSMQLKSLEASLGVSLFKRDGRRLKLTTEGEVLRQHAFKLAEWKARLLSEVQKAEAYRRSKLRLGFLDGISKSLIVQLSTAVMQKQPELNLYLAEGRGPALVQDLRDRSLDAVVLNYSPESTALGGLRVKKRASLEVGLFKKGPIHEIKNRSAINKVLSSEPLILPTYDSRLRGELDRYFIENRIAINTRVEVQDTAVQKLLALQGHGIALLPVTTSSRSALSEGSLQLLAILPGVREDVWMLTRDDPDENEFTEILWDDSI